MFCKMPAEIDCKLLDEIHCEIHCKMHFEMHGELHTGRDSLEDTLCDVLERRHRDSRDASERRPRE